MNMDKIGSFLKKMREEKGYTQDELADKIPIGRTAISKWERGVTIPDPIVLVKISEIFNISINEILKGEKNIQNTTSDDVTFELYKKNYKSRKIIKVLSFSTFILMFCLLAVYFVLSYKTTKVYNVYGFGKNFEMNNGFIIFTREKYYFSTGYIENKKNYKITKLELYIKEKNGEMKLVNSEDSSTMFLIDIYGYDEYNLINFINDEYITYLKIYYNDTFEIIKLTYKKDYINDSIFPIKTKKSADLSSNSTNNYSKTDFIMDNLINFLQKDENGNYFKKIMKNNLYVQINYNKNTNIINLIVENDEEECESWTYNLSADILTYINNEISFVYKDKIECLSEDCSIWSQKTSEFWNTLFSLIN